MNFLKSLCIDKSASVGIFILLLLIVFSIFGPLLVDGSPSMLGDREQSMEQPSKEHIFKRTSSEFYNKSQKQIERLESNNLF